MAKKAKRKLSPYNRHVQREMKKGRSMKQAAASWKSGRRRPSIRRTVSRAKPRRRRAVAKRKPSGGRKMAGFNTQKLMKYVRLAALVAPAAVAATGGGTPRDKLKEALFAYTGFDIGTGQFNAAGLAKGWMPYLAAVGVTYGIPKLAGIIRGL